MSPSSRRRRALGWSVAVVAMGLLVVGMASMKSGPDSGDPVRPTSQLVAVVDGDVVIVSADDGSVLRTLARGDAVDVVVSPDGLFAYFTRVEGSGECAAGEIVRVPLGDGDEEVIATGSHPVVSPDAEQLAYEGIGPYDICPPVPQLVVHDLDPGDEHIWPEVVSDTGDVSVPSAVVPLAWAPDARVLAYGLEFPGSEPESFLLDSEGTSRFLLDDSAPLPLAPDLQPIAYQSDGSLVVIDGDTVVLVDPATGAIERTLIDAGAPITAAWSDGKRVAYTTGDGLSVWTPGDDEPRRLDVEVASAAWLP